LTASVRSWFWRLDVAVRVLVLLFAFVPCLALLPLDALPLLAFAAAVWTADAEQRFGGRGAVLLATIARFYSMRFRFKPVCYITGRPRRTRLVHLRA